MQSFEKQDEDFMVRLLPMAGSDRAASLLGESGS
jgi:hypothetical protein